MIRVHFLISKLNIEHIIALGGKKSNEKLEKKGNQCKNAAKMYGRRQWKNPAASLLLNLHIKPQSAQHVRIILHILAGEGLLAGKSRRLCVFFIFNDPQI